MIKLVYPEPIFKIKTEAGRDFVFDTIRKQWVVLTPEEWVRQNFINYLLYTKQYPSALLAVEKEIQLGELKKRFDILVYDGNHQPWMMIECKSQEVALDQQVLNQLLRYHLAMPVDYLVLTNGDYCYGWNKSGGQLVEITALPEFEQ
ncbi:MAG: restriction endonuclease subunit R [Terrimonas sp.]|nr:restriction endonuclease subunit R [Terrimonas sp.]